MTKNNEHTSTNTSVKGKTVSDLLAPRYTAENRARLENLRSRINVARAILAARVERGLTQEELGKAAGTKQSRVSEIEAMKGNPRFETLDRIARPLGLMIALLPRDGNVLLPKGYRDRYQASTKYTLVANATKTTSYTSEGGVARYTGVASGMLYG